MIRLALLLSLAAFVPAQPERSAGENDNGHVDRNVIGIPKEGVGFSNDAAFFLGPPSWRVARFEIGPEGRTVKLRLRYMRG